MSELTPSQKSAADAILSGRDVLLAGPAGTGKSFLIDWLKSRRSMSLTATTGIAAANIGGTTLHSWAGIGLGKGTVDYVVSRMSREAKGRILEAKTLVIDEVSMASKWLISLIDGVFQVVRGNDQSFGGVQMVFCGDFLQLPPVEQGKAEPKFAFESDSWRGANIQVCELKEVVRQADAAFANLLNAVRVADESFDFSPLLDRVGRSPGDEPCTRLYTHNADVDAFNHGQLKDLDGEEVVFNAEDGGHPQLVKDCRLPDVLRLKPGALVMSLLNKGALVNGSLGVVTEIKNGLPVVDFGEAGEWECGRTSREITRGFETVKVTPSGNPELPWRDDRGTHYGGELAQNGTVTRPRVVASRKQIPLRLAWAITVHKSQGMTLDRVEVDLSRTFAPGMVYTALSRVKTLDGLFIKGLKSIEANDKALNFYQTPSHGRS